MTCNHQNPGALCQGCTWCAWEAGRDGRQDAVRDILLRMLKSATPTLKDHPTMWHAWGDAARFIGENADTFRVPTVACECDTCAGRP